MGSVGTTSTFVRNPKPQGDENNTSTNATLDNFRKMSTEDASKFVEGVSDVGWNNEGYNPHAHFQAVTKALGLNDKPVVLPDADFDKQVKTEALGGVELYRGYGYQATTAVVDSVKFGDVTYQGVGIHGDGTYLSTNPKTASSYTNNAKLASITAFIDKNKAKAVTEANLRNMFNNESLDVRKQFRALSNHGASADTESALSAYALHKGYNVIHVPGGNSGTHMAFGNGKTRNGYEDYYVALTRDVLVIRDNTKVR